MSVEIESMRATGQLGFIIGAFVISLLLAGVWLIISKAIPPLRRKLHVSFGTAIALVFIPLLITIDGPNIFNITGTLLSIGLLFLALQVSTKRKLLTIKS